jgi:type I restriction enzyme S subunit
MGWEKCRLGDLFLAIKNGANVVQVEADNGEWAVSRIETIWNGTVDPDRVKWTSADQSLLATHRLQVGDILFSHINSPEHIAKTAIYMGEPEILIHGINLLRMRVDRKLVDPIWMTHFLKAPTTRSHFRTRCKKAVNQASLNQTDIKTFDAYLPPLPLQQKFTAIVESIERQKTTQRAHLAELDALFAALQHRAFRGEL